MSHTVSYKYSKGKITKDGHTMFDMDIVSDLNRKSFLEVNKQELEAEKKELIDRLGKIMRSMLVHPDCVEGTEFDDQTSSANDLINKLKQ